tara:strand:- start:46 stop:867 length:822 start_codon:yes stop_codon:yes gene_type:complete
MRNIFKLPIKDFMRNPVIKNSSYKRLIDLCLNMSKNKSRESNKNTNDLLNNGYVIIDDFLTEGRFNALKDLLDQIKDFKKQENEGFISSKRNVSQMISKEFSEFDFINELVRDFYGFKEIEKPNIVYHINECYQKIDYKTIDTSQNLHIDRIYNTIKFFYFISDVSEKDFPFTLIPGTQSGKLDPKFYDEAFSKFLNPNGYPSYLKLIEKFKLNNVKSFNVKKNTLVIADTSCLHRRGDFEIGSKRFLLLGSYLTTVSVQVILKNLFKKFKFQ